MTRTKPNRNRPGPPRRGRTVDLPRLDWAATQPCCVTGRFPATTHHVRFCGSPKDDTRIIRLITELHLHDAGMLSIERIGKEKFEAEFGISIENEIAKLNRRYQDFQRANRAISGENE